MHTFVGETCRIHFDGGHDGEAIIVPFDENGNTSSVEVRIKESDLHDFVASYVRDSLINKIDEMETSDLLQRL